MRVNESKSRATTPLNSITVSIISASNLAPADIIGSSDPFCEVLWQGELMHTTAMLPNTLDPFWDESVSLSFKPEALRMSELRVIVYDHDIGGRKDFLGQVTLKLEDLVRKPGKTMEIPLLRLPNNKENRDCATQGSIRLMIDFIRDETFNTWTAPVPIGHPTSEAVAASTSDGERHLLEVNVQESNSFNIITVNEYSSSNRPAFMIVNRVQDLHLRFRQKHTSVAAYPRQIVRPMEYLYYAWDDCNLSKVIDLVAVDKHGNESPAESYVLENVGKKHSPLNVSMLDNHRTLLLVKVVIEGHTRKLVISNDYKERKKKPRKSARHVHLTSDMSIDNHIRFVCSLSGLSLSIIDELPRELIHFTVDDIEICSLPHSNKIQLTVRHMQLDNMLSDTDYPVVLSPFDAGYNSHLNEDYNYFTKEYIPFLEVTLELDYQSLTEDTLIVEYCEVKMQELNMFLDFNFIVRMATSMVTPQVIAAVSRVTRVVFSQMDLQEMRSQVDRALVQRVVLPQHAHADNYALMMFFKALILHSVGVRITLCVALKKDIDIDPRSIGSQVEYSTIRNLMSLSRGITNINPHFVFGSISISNAFDTMNGIGWRLGKFYISSAGMQALRLLGSAEIIGDPAGGLISLGSSIRMFAIKTKSEIEGQAPVRAEGLKHLVQGVASISFGTVSKVANSVGEQLASVTGSDFKTDMAAKNPSHVGKGALQGGSIFYKTCKAGVTNVYKKPMEGYRKRSISKTAKGVVTGISGLALAPIVGALGATAKLTKGIEATAHVFDDKPVGRIRPARSLFYSPQIRPLDHSVFLVEFSVIIRGVDLSFVSQKSKKSPPFYNFSMDEEECSLPPRFSSASPAATHPAENTVSSESEAGRNVASSALAASHAIVVHIKYGSQERTSRDLPLVDIIRMTEKDLVKFNFKVKSKKGKFEKRMVRVSISVKHKNVFGMQATVSKGLLHPLDLVSFLRHDKEALSAGSSHEHLSGDLPEDPPVWQFKGNETQLHRPTHNPDSSTFSEADGPLMSLTRKNRASHDPPPSEVSDLQSIGGVSVLTRGVGSSKMSQYVQSIVDDPHERLQVVSELNSFATYPETVGDSYVRKSFVDPISDMHTSTKDIFSVDCFTKVASKKRNAKELLLLRDILSPSASSAGSGTTPVSSDSTSTITMTTVTPPTRMHRLPDTPSQLRQQPEKEQQAGEGQEELFRVAEGLRFKLFLSGSFVSAPADHL